MQTNEQKRRRRQQPKRSQRTNAAFSRTNKFSMQMSVQFLWAMPLLFMLHFQKDFFLYPSHSFALNILDDGDFFLLDTASVSSTQCICGKRRHNNNFNKLQCQWKNTKCPLFTCTIFFSCLSFWYFFVYRLNAI